MNLNIFTSPFLSWILNICTSFHPILLFIVTDICLVSAHLTAGLWHTLFKQIFLQNDSLKFLLLVKELSEIKVCVLLVWILFFWWRLRRIILSISFLKNWDFGWLFLRGDWSKRFESCEHLQFVALRDRSSTLGQSIGHHFGIWSVISIFNLLNVEFFDQI